MTKATGKGRGGKRKGAGRKPKRRKRVELVHDYGDLGDPPKDELKGVGWAFKLATLAANEIRMELSGSVSATERKDLRAELRSQLGVINKLMPRARLLHAEEIVTGDADRMGRTTKDPVTEPIPVTDEERGGK